MSINFHQFRSLKMLGIEIGFLGGDRDRNDRDPSIQSSSQRITIGRPDDPSRSASKVRPYGQQTRILCWLCSGLPQTTKKRRSEWQKSWSQSKIVHYISAQKLKFQMKRLHIHYFSPRNFLTPKRMLEMTYNPTWFLDFQTYLQSCMEQ